MKDRTWIIEIGTPIWWKPWKYESELITRRGWLCFVIGRLKVPFRQFCETPQRWESPG